MCECALTFMGIYAASLQEQHSHLFLEAPINGIQTCSFVFFVHLGTSHKKFAHPRFLWILTGSFNSASPYAEVD